LTKFVFVHYFVFRTWYALHSFDHAAYQKRQLQALSPNIHVMRHGGLLWTHHEKLVVVDRAITFCGGLDICWGRWDSGVHVIADPDKRFFPKGIEMYNPALAGETGGQCRRAGRQTVRGRRPASRTHTITHYMFRDGRCCFLLCRLVQGRR